MSMIRSLRPLLIALAAAGVCAAAGAAEAQPAPLLAPLPAIHTQGPVVYLSGGVGRDEAHAIEQAASRWPVMLEFAAREGNAQQGAWLANVSVQILDAQHHAVLETVSDGPFVLARLQPGHYEVKATFDGQTLARPLDVPRQGTAREVFLWPHAAEHAAG